MITSLGLDSFKSFDKLYGLELKPLTVLCGVNSGGKSSIVKSLLMLKQTSEDSSIGAEAMLNGPLVLNGTMKDIVHNGLGQEFSISNTFRIKNANQKFVKDAKQDITVSKELQKIFNINVSGCFELYSSYTFSKKVNSVSPLENILKQLSIRITHNSSNMERRLGEIQIRYKDGGRYQVLINELFTADQNESINTELDECTCYFKGIRLNNLFCTTPPQNVQLSVVLPIIYNLTRIVADQFSGIRFIGPLRDYPERSYVISKSMFNNEKSGSLNPLRLRQYSNISIKDKIYPPQKEEDFDCLVKMEKNKYFSVLNKWMEYLGMGTVTFDGENDSLALRINGINIVDVGFGVSQILPILTEALLLEKEQTLILEQPEIHLHPKMQMNLSDLFLRLSSNKRNVIVETHSDHVINRIVRRVLECKDETLKNMVAIYYIEKRDGKSIIEEISIDRVQGIVDCPVAFFSQFASETGYIFNAGMENLRRKK